MPYISRIVVLLCSGCVLTSYPLLPCKSFHVRTYSVTLYHVAYDTILYHIISYHIISYHIISLYQSVLYNLTISCHVKHVMLYVCHVVLCCYVIL